jgi:hypothetical protein
MKRLALFILLASVTTLLGFTIMKTNTNSELFHEFEAFFPKAAYPIKADSIFLESSCKTSKEIDTKKFIRFFPVLFPRGGFHGFDRFPPHILVYPVAKISQTPQYSAFLYVESFYREPASYLMLRLHVITFNKNGVVTDDYVIAQAHKDTKEGKWLDDKYNKYEEATITIEKTANDVTLPNEEKLTFSKKGFVVQQKESGNSCKKINF